MMTSGQIAGMMSQQNQYFAGSAQYSQQISQQMPGAYGAGVGGSPGFAQVPGGVPQQGGFSYGGSQGYGTANRVSGGITSAMGGAAQFALAGAGIAAGFGMLGKMGSAALDPFAGGGVGWRMGGRAASAMNLGRVGSGAMRLGMGAVGMLPAAGILAAGSHVIGSMMSGAREDAAVENVLGRHQFMGASSNQRGFSRGQAQGVSDMMKGMEALPEMMTSMSELTRIMDKMGQMGVMQGASNVAEFKTKFKQNIKLLKDMSKVMASSMEEALPMFGEIKRTGFYTAGDILKNAMNRQITGGATGMSQGQVSQVAQYGAQVSYQQGGTLKSGAQHSLRVAAQLGTAQRMGLLSDDQVREYTGGTGGARGIQMMSQRLTGLAHKMARSSVGMVTGIALGEVKDGSFTGKMDEGLMARHRAGEFSLSELHAMARQKTRTRQAKMSYVSRKNKIRAEMAAGMGVEGTTQVLRHALGDRGFTSPDAQRIMAQRFGMTERDTDLLPMLDKMPDIMAEMKNRGRADVKRIAQDSFMKSQYSWEAVKSKASKKIASITTEPFKRFGASIRRGINELVDDFVDDITGRYKAEVSKGMSSLLRGALAGEKMSQKRLTQMMESSGFLDKGGQGADFTPGRLASAMNWMTGSQTSGERGLETLKAMGVQTYSGSSGAALRRQGVTTLGADHSYIPFVSSSFEGAKREDIRRASERLMQMGSGGEDTRTSRIADVMRGQSGAALGLHKQMASLLRTKSHLFSGKNAHEGFMGLASGVGAQGWRGLQDQTTLSEGMAEAGLGDVSDVEMAKASLSITGMDSSRINSMLRAEGRSLGGLTGRGSMKDAADRIKKLKRSLRGRFDEDWDEIEAQLGNYGSDRSSDLLFGTPGGKRGGLLTGTSRRVTAGIMHDESTKGRIARKRIFGSDEDEYRTRQVSVAMEGLAEKVGYRELLGGDTLGRNAKQKREFANQIIQKMASDRLTMIDVEGPGGQRSWERNLTDHERTFYKANKRAVQDVMGTHVIKDALSQRAAGKKVDPEKKAWLKKRYNIDVDSISPEKAKVFLDLKAAKDSGKLDEEGEQELKDLRMDQWTVGLAQAMEDVSAEGSGIQRQVALARGVAGDLGINLSDEAKSLLTDIESQGAIMSRANTSKAAALLGQKALSFGELSGRLGKLSKKERALVLKDQAALGSAYAKRKRTEQLLRRAGGRGGRSVSLSKMFDSDALMGMDESARTEILGIAGEDKKFDKAEQEQLVQYMANKASTQTMAASGIISKNAQANPADIAASMTTFVESTKQLASFIQANFPKDKK